MLPFELGKWRKNALKYKVSKWGIENPKTIFRNMLFEYVTFSFIWTSFDINDNFFQQSPHFPLMATIILPL